MPFDTVSALLRLGNKYALADLEQEAVERLEKIFPSSLDDFEHELIQPTCRRADLNLFCPKSRVSFKSSDAITAINLARTYDIPSLLPSAFYMCSRLPIDILVKGAPPSRHMLMNSLARDDLIRCWNGQLELGHHYMSMAQTLTNAISENDCSTSVTCCSVKANWIVEMEEETNSASCLDTMGCCLMAPNLTYLADVEMGLCRECIQRREEIWEQFRQSIWNALPNMFDVISSK